MTPEWLTTRKIAHRGLHNSRFPENSLGAFENACNNNFPLELDVHILEDGNVAVFHDDTLVRMCGVHKALYDVKVEDLKTYRLANTEYYIPTLQETLNLIDGRVPIVLELKAFKKPYLLCSKVMEIMKEYKGDYVVKSFNPLAIMWFKKNAPNITRGMLSSSLKDIKLPRLYKILIKRLSLFKLCKPDFISYNVDDIPNKFIENKKVPLLSWTIRSPEQETFALNIVDNILFENYIPKNKLVEKK